jgi:hypothetical protein
MEIVDIKIEVLPQAYPVCGKDWVSVEALLLLMAEGLRIRNMINRQEREYQQRESL